MLILPHSCFLHVPKTGGTWVRHAIRASGIDGREFGVDGNPHPGLDACPCPEKFKFAFVRHPLSLYRSFWQFRQTHGWDMNNEIDRACRNDDFGQFVRNVLLHFPGIYSQSLENYVGKKGAEINFIGRFENLAEDLVRALQLAGETFDADAIRALPAINVSDKQKAVAEFTGELEQAVRKAEAEAFTRFGYQ